jgi:hypothetical protein
MRRPASLVAPALVPALVAALAFMVALPGCHTDEPRRADDAGAVSAPTTPIAVTPPVVDAGVAVPVVEEAVDAGHVSDGGDGGDVGDGVAGHTGGARIGSGLGAGMGAGIGAPGIGKPPPVAVDPLQVTIFNRILARAKTRDLNPGQVQELAERLTKQKVDKTRRTAGTFWLIQFAPTTPPRGKAEQQRLIEQLKSGGDFEFVEADQVMTVK